jgi:hypothetical protein
MSRKRRRKGNPEVSGETVMYGYESSATLTTDRLQYKLQTRLFVREGAPRRRGKQFSGKRKENVKSCHGLQEGARHQDILTDWTSVVKWLRLRLRLWLWDNPETAVRRVRGWCEMATILRGLEPWIGNVHCWKTLPSNAWRPQPRKLSLCDSAGNRTRDLWISSQKLWPQRRSHQKITQTKIHGLLVFELQSRSISVKMLARLDRGIDPVTKASYIFRINFGAPETPVMRLSVQLVYFGLRSRCDQ